MRSISRTSVLAMNTFGRPALIRLRKEPSSGWRTAGRSRSRIGTSANQIISGKNTLVANNLHAFWYWSQFSYCDIIDLKSSNLGAQFPIEIRCSFPCFIYICDIVLCWKKELIPLNLKKITLILAICLICLIYFYI